MRTDTQSLKHFQRHQALVIDQFKTHDSYLLTMVSSLLSPHTYTAHSSQRKADLTHTEETKKEWYAPSLCTDPILPPYPFMYLYNPIPALSFQQKIQTSILPLIYHLFLSSSCGLGDLDTDPRLLANKLLQLPTRFVLRGRGGVDAGGVTPDSISSSW